MRDLAYILREGMNERIRIWTSVQEDDLNDPTARIEPRV
jgi:hypothetical protein